MVIDIIPISTAVRRLKQLVGSHGINDALIMVINHNITNVAGIKITKHLLVIAAVQTIKQPIGFAGRIKRQWVLWIQYHFDDV